MLAKMSDEDLDTALENVSLRIQEASEELVKELERRENLLHDIDVQNQLLSFLSLQKKNAHHNHQSNVPQHKGAK